jgi:Phosphotransferase enzyme family
MRNDESYDALRAIAEALSGRRVDWVVSAAAGGNSRIYRVRCGQLDFALKCYPPHDSDPRDRASTEFKALRFLERFCPGRAPRAYAVNAEDGYLLLEWIEGSRVTEAGAGEVDDSVAFLGTLFDASARPEARDLPLASEACLSGEEIVRQLLSREAKLRGVSGGEQALIEFLDSEFVPARKVLVDEARDGYAKAKLDFAVDLATSSRSLVPSDFGFHNAMRRADGVLIFVDHEYFGWDDPVKVTADFMLHPATPLADDLARRFWRAVCSRRANDEAFLTRLKILYPLFGARWCLILLNEFLPERWMGRVFAGARGEWASAKVEQLRRARGLLREVLSKSQGLFNEQ